MKKLLVIIAVLSLIAGTVYAADLNDGLTKQVWAQAKGRSVVSNGSVLLRVWYTGSGSGTVDVSCNSVNVYDNGVLTATDFGTYGTVQNVVDRINDLTTWKAAVGPDGCPGALIGTSLQLPIAANNTAAGTNRTNPTYVYRDSSTSRRLSVGIEATDGKINRIKSITSKYAATLPGTITVLVYDGDTLVWRKDTSSVPYNTAADKNASPDTISFVNSSDKGLAGSLGKSLVAVVSADTATIQSSPIAADKVTDHNISIVYDQF